MLIFNIPALARLNVNSNLYCDVRLRSLSHVSELCFEGFMKVIDVELQWESAYA